MNHKITEADYAFIEKASSAMYSVKIKNGPFSGVIATYGKVSLKESADKEVATLSFQFRVDEAPASHNIVELEKSEDFNNHLGDILSHIIQSAFDSGKYKFGSDDKQSTDNNSPKTD